MEKNFVSKENFEYIQKSLINNGRKIDNKSIVMVMKDIYKNRYPNDTITTLNKKTINALILPPQKFMQNNIYLERHEPIPSNMLPFTNKQYDNDNDNNYEIPKSQILEKPPNEEETIKKFNEINKQRNDSKRIKEEIKKVENNNFNVYPMTETFINKEDNEIDPSYNINFEVHHKDMKELDNKEKKKLEENYEFHPNSIYNFPSPVVLPPKQKYSRRTYFVSIDSKDRNLELYPNPAEFLVKFNPTTNQPTSKKIIVGNVGYCFNDEILGDWEASIPLTYDNIVSIKCVSALVPLETIWTSGISPNRYYDQTVDTAGFNCSSSTPPVENNSFRAIYNNYIGINITVLDDLYVILNIKELESYSPYTGTNSIIRNAFAKLVYDTDFGITSRYVKLVTTDSEEYYNFVPTTLGKLDKFTLKLIRPEGELLSFGIDKNYIFSITESPNNVKYCKTKKATRIILDIEKTFGTKSPFCSCEEAIQGCGIKPGDLLYFYDTRPCKINYITFQNLSSTITYRDFYLIINEVLDEQMDISIFIIINDNGEPIDFNKFANSGDYLVLKFNGIDCEYKFKIISINKTRILISINPSIDLTEDMIIDKIGITQEIKRGYQTNQKYDLLYNGGIRVQTVGDSTYSTELGGFCSQYNPENYTSYSGQELPDTPNYIFFDLDFPYDSIQKCYIENYHSGDIFFIKQKCQISYTFKITVVEKDTSPLESLLVGS